MKKYLVLFASLLMYGSHAPPAYAVPCVISETANTTLSSACTIEGTEVSDGTFVTGAPAGDVTVSGADITVQPNTTLTWPEGYSIRIQNNGRLFLSSGSVLKQTEYHPYLLQRMGFDTYAAGNPVRIFENNLFVCTGATCTITAPSAAGNVMVEGQIKIAGGSPGSGKVLTSDANGLGSWQTASGIPYGMIAAFATTCPGGWTEYTSARGRYIVGVPAGGTITGTAGTALSNQENRAVGQHSHSTSDAGHSHSVNDPTHSHTVNDPGHTHTSTYNPSGNAYTLWDDRSVAYPNAANTTGSSTTGVWLNASGTGISLNGNTTGVTINNAGSVAGTNAPYIQLTWCMKT